MDKSKGKALIYINGILIGTSEGIIYIAYTNLRKRRTMVIIKDNIIEYRYNSPFLLGNGQTILLN